MAIRTRQAKNKRDSNGVLTGRPGTVYDVDIKYTAPDGAKKSYTKRGFATKSEAAQHEAEMKTKLQNPGQIASITSQRKQTVAAYLNDWVESYARVNLRPSTYDGYKKTIARRESPTTTMTLLWQSRTVRLSMRLGYRRSLVNFLKIWKCRISVFTICAIQQLRICTN